MRWLVSALAMVTIAIRADTIRFTNGNALEGIVRQETDKQIVLDLGTGSTTFPRSAIAAVQRATEEENNLLRAGWKRKYFLHREYVPAELTALASDFTKLGAQREEALRASRSLAILAATEAGVQAEQERLRAQSALASRRLQQPSPTDRSQVEAYNALVAESNAMQARWTAMNEVLASCRKERDAAIEHLSAYQDAVSAFQRRVDEERTKPGGEATGEERRQFFDRVAQRLEEYTREFASAEVSVTQSKAGAVVAATVNDQIRGRFIVDTGADRVTVTESFARRLKLELEALPEAEFTMADGHRTKGRIVVLRSLAAGDARVENVEAAILPGKPGEQVDGLLGMSFLRHFSVNLDGSSGKLILRQFAPGQKEPKKNAGVRMQEAE